MDFRCITRVQIEYGKESKQSEWNKFITYYFTSKFIQESHIEYRQSFKVFASEENRHGDIQVFELMKNNDIDSNIEGIYFFKDGLLHRDEDLPAIIYTKCKPNTYKYYKKGVSYIPEEKRETDYTPIPKEEKIVPIPMIEKSNPHPPTSEDEILDGYGKKIISFSFKDNPLLEVVITEYGIVRRNEITKEIKTFQPNEKGENVKLKVPIYVTLKEKIGKIDSILLFNGEVKFVKTGLNYVPLSKLQSSDVEKIISNLEK